MINRPRVLVSAYACEPGKGSEPGVGWHWVQQIAKFADVWVITRANNKEPIEERVGKSKISEDVNWVYYDLPKILRFWKKGQKGIRVYYYLWQIGIFFKARKLHKTIGFDLIHHVTIGMYWMPSFLVILDEPLIWGPVGGGEKLPKGFYKTLSFRGKIYELIRAVAKWMLEHDPFTRKTIRQSFPLAKAEETSSRLRNLGSDNVILFPESGISIEKIQRHKSYKNNNHFIIASVGRLLHWKGYHLGIRSYAQIAKKFPYSKYWVMGEGPKKEKLIDLSEKLNISDQVMFFGRLPRDQTLRKLSECDVLLHPSLHDSGGWVCLEAMALGKPVICLDHGGPALQVTDRTGFKIPPNNPSQTINGIAESLTRLASDQTLKSTMGITGVNRVENYFSWNKKGDFIESLYKSVLKNRLDDFKQGKLF